MNDEMESSSEPENDSSDQLQATPMMITMMIVKMKQWLRIFNDNGEIAVNENCDSHDGDEARGGDSI